MENSVLGILHSTLLGLRLTSQELLLLSQHMGISAKEIMPKLSFASQERLKSLNWEEEWKKFLEESFKSDIKFVSLFCPDYPDSLKIFEKPPPFLTYLGQALWKEKKFISVVGSRQPNRESLEWMTQHLLSFLKSSQLSVVSGGARGIDQWAHQVSLASGMSTLCLLPSGLKNIYPHSLNPILSAIVDSGGAVLSGYGLHQAMRVYFFHQRNRWIAQFGHGCLVVESRVKSGSYLTAQLAANLGKEVMALPCAVWDRQGQGNLQLIKDGAHMVRNDRDILDILGF